MQIFYNNIYQILSKMKDPVSNERERTESCSDLRTQSLEKLWQAGKFMKKVSILQSTPNFGKRWKRRERTG